MTSSLNINDAKFKALMEVDLHFQEALPRISKFFTMDNLTNEANAFNYFESSIPKDEYLDIHLDMIFTPGAVSDYYRSTVDHKNKVLEAARKAFPNMQEITESYDAFKRYLAPKLFEGIELAAPTADLGGDVDAAIAGASGSSSDEGFWSMCKRFLGMLTEDFSVIGVIQFLLDLIGAFGDYIIPGLGVVADLINAVIYAVRRMWLLAAISLIAALVVGAGDALKLFKGAAKTANPIFVKLVAGNVDEAVEAAAKAGIKPGSESVSLLKKVAGWIGGAVASAITFIGKAINGFGSWVGWVPGLGGALKWIFEMVGGAFTSFGKSMNLFCDSLRGFEKNLSKRALTDMANTVKKADAFKLSDDGTELIGYSAKGKEIGRVPATHFDKLGLEVKYGKSASATKELFSTPEEFVKYSKSVKSAKIPKAYDSKFKAWLELKGAKRWKDHKMKLFLILMGKQIYKVINGGLDWEEGKGWTAPELETHGSAALNTMINDMISKKRKEENAVYLPSIDLDTRDQEVVDHIVNYQNNYAKMYGQPTVAHLVYDRYGNEDEFKEFDEFFKDVEEGNVEAGGSGDKVDKTVADDLEKEESLWQSQKTGGEWESTPAEKSAEGKTESTPSKKTKPALESRSVLSFSDFKK